MKKAIMIVLALMLTTGAVFAQTGGANFGNYPADYGIAYSQIAGFSRVPTVRTLFGPDAHFLTSLDGVPARVTIESSSGTQTRFTAQLLLTLQVPGTGDTNVARMQVTFEADSFSQMSYVRQVNSVVLLTGYREDRRSTGTQTDDANLLGFFFGMMEVFWDVSKYY